MTLNHRNSQLRFDAHFKLDNRNYKPSIHDRINIKLSEKIGLNAILMRKSKLGKSLI